MTTSRFTLIKIAGALVACAMAGGAFANEPASTAAYKMVHKDANKVELEQKHKGSTTVIDQKGGVANSVNGALSAKKLEVTQDGNRNKLTMVGTQTANVDSEVVVTSKGSDNTTTITLEGEGLGSKVTATIDGSTNTLDITSAAGTTKQTEVEATVKGNDNAVTLKAADGDKIIAKVGGASKLSAISTSTGTTVNLESNKAGSAVAGEFMIDVDSKVGNKVKVGELNGGGSSFTQDFATQSIASTVQATNAAISPLAAGSKLSVTQTGTGNEAVLGLNGAGNVTVTQAGTSTLYATVSNGNSLTVEQTGGNNAAEIHANNADAGAAGAVFVVKQAGNSRLYADFDGTKVGATIDQKENTGLFTASVGNFKHEMTNSNADMKSTLTGDGKLYFATWKR